MKAFLTYLSIQLRMDLRNRGTLLTYYITPLIFFFVMGAVFTSITPDMKTTLAASMTIFAATMGTVMGAPTPLVQMRESGTLRAYRVCGISERATLTVSACSTFIHMVIVSSVITFLAPVAFGASMPENLLFYYGVLILFLYASVGIGMLIGIWAKNQSVATMISMLVFLPSLLLSGIMFPASMLPGILGAAGKLFPATYALQAFGRLAYGISDGASLTAALLMMGGIGSATFLLSVSVGKRAAKLQRM